MQKNKTRGVCGTGSQQGHATMRLRSSSDASRARPKPQAPCLLRLFHDLVFFGDSTFARCGMKLGLLSLAACLLAIPAFSQCKEAVSPKGRFEMRGTVEAGENICPLSPAQKGKLYLLRATSPYNIVSAAAAAGIWQATQNSHEGFGQGPRAYGSRFGASLANHESALLLNNFVLSSLLNMDPRYFRKGTGTTGSRLGYALTRVLVGRTDGGRSTLNVPELFGALGSAGLSNVYYPPYDRTATRTLESAGVTIAADAGWNIIREFAGNFGQLFGRKK